ncbi:hypothetical protein Bca52824_070889 [Brassica carinata]|uniref:Uncharacterized protein n=1 Tax=Brassica carinata TaxID=52824 RepID=A0A8X7Q5C5_BRACI|nr:hypothetical protein Bca52824_070889 [Brassica carinata]
MRLNEEPPLSSSVTTTRGSSRAIESIRNGSERWRRGGLTTNLRHHILHRSIKVNKEVVTSTEEKKK